MRKYKSIITILVGIFTVVPAFAQQSELHLVNQLKDMNSTQITLLAFIAVALVLILILLSMMIYFLSFLRKLLNNKENAALTIQSNWWGNFKQRFVTGKMKPIEEEEELMMDHSYDGIVELDNFMPPWLKYLFYASIIGAVVYFMNYSVLNLGKTQLEEYEEELRIAAIQAEIRESVSLASIDETNVDFDDSAPAIKAGQEIYDNNCAACHAKDGGGGVGPNLTDEYWIHGGNISDIFRVIKFGVVEKGMIPWQDQLSPEEMQQVSSYILTLQGSTTANPKEPQGEKLESIL